MEKNTREGWTMLFRRHIEPCCAYCARGTNISDTETICYKKGVVSASGQCRSFRYDPLKREPPAPAALDGSKYSQEDFSLD